MHRLARLAAYLSFCVATAVPVWAQTDPIFGAAGFQQNRDYFSAGPTEHVDTLTGNLILTYTDLVLPGSAGHDVRFERTYNANEGRWTFGVTPLIENLAAAFPTDPPSSPIFVDATGARHQTRHMSLLNPNWMATEDFWKYDQGNKTLYLPDGSTVLYDDDDRPIVSRDAFGNRVQATYGEGVTVVTQFFGGESRSVQLHYPVGNRFAVTSLEFLDRTWTYASTPGSLVVTPPVGTPWQYAYVGTPGAGNSSVLVTTPQGGTVLYEFEPHTFQVKDAPPDGSGSPEYYTAAVLTRRASSGQGVTPGEWTYTYAFADGPNSYVTTMEAPDGSSTTFEYGTAYLAGEPTFVADGPSLIRRTVNGSPAEEERLWYRALAIPGSTYAVRLGQRVITRAGRSYTTTYRFASSRYGDYHRPNWIEEIGELERTTERTFDYSTPYGFEYQAVPPPGYASFLGPVALERVTVGGVPVIRSWQHDVPTGFTTQESRYGLVTLFAPDGAGNLAFVEKANDVSTTFEYQWGVVSTIVTAAHTTTRTINPDSTVASETQGDRTATFVYDAVSRMISSDPPGAGRNDVVTDYGDEIHVTVSRGPSTTTTTLDGFGRPTRVDAPGASTTTTYDAMGRATFTSYPFVTAPPIGTTNTYDALGRVTRRTNPDGTYVEHTYGAGSVTIRDESNHATTQTWQAFGSPDDARLASVTDATGNRWAYEYTTLGTLTRVEAPGGVVRQWRYDDAARPERLTSETHPESGTVAYTEYDPAGHLTRKVDANGTLFQYEYDGNDRPLRITAGTRVTTFAYETGTDNRRAGSVDGVQTTWSYDDGGRVRARVDVVPDSAPQAQSFTYDGNDNLASITYATGRVIAYAYDAANRVISVTETSAVDGPKVHASGFTYHPSGAVTSYQTLNGVVHTVDYDPQRYWPTRIRAGALDLKYEDYDAVGNVRRITDARPSMDQFFQYDPLDRLTQALGPYGTVQYAYDPHGNRQTNAYSSYAYENFRLVQQNNEFFTYDNNGNLKTGTGQGATYNYTPDNQLESSSVGGVDATYLYDVDGWRIAKTSGLRSLFTRGVGGQLMSEVRPSITRDYLYAGTRLIGVLRHQSGEGEPAVGPVLAQRNPAGLVTVSFSSTAPAGVPLAEAALRRALQTASCTPANASGCTWTTVDTLSAPANSLSWSDSTSLTDTPPAGVAQVYTVQVTDIDGAVGTGATVPIEDLDVTPDAFSFVNQTGVAIGVVVDSEIVHITGITSPAPTTVTGAGTYRICATSTCSTNPPFSAGPSTIANGAYLQLRVTSSTVLDTAVTTTMSVGGGSAVWTVTTTSVDDTPDAFSFTPQTGVAVATTIDSNIVQVTGIAGNVAVSVSGAGAYRICTNGTCSTNPGFVTSGQTLTNNAYLQLRVVSSGSPSTAVTTTVTVGTGSGTWTVTTAGPDWDPNPFTFTDQTNVARSTLTFSNILQITGITGNAPTSINQAAYRVCADATCSALPPFTTGASTMVNGQYLQLRLLSSANFLTTISITMTVGSRSDTWSVTTAAQDVAPDTFSFLNQTGVPPNTQIYSAAVQVTGITGAVATSVAGTGVGYRVCTDVGCTAGSGWTSSPSTITNAQYVQMYIWSSPLGSTTTSRTLTVGSYSTTWSVTTAADPCAGTPAPGTTCSDGTKFAGYSPASGTKMYTTPNDWGWVHFAWPEALWGGTNNVDGRANTNGLAPFGNYAAANACYYLNANGKDDWYLPAPNEWNAMDPNRTAIGGFAPDDTLYWTSAELDGGEWFGAIYHALGGSFNGYTGQGVSLAVRCVRRD